MACCSEHRRSGQANLSQPCIQKREAVPWRPTQSWGRFRTRCGVCIDLASQAGMGKPLRKQWGPSQGGEEGRDPCGKLLLPRTIGYLDGIKQRLGDLITALFSGFSDSPCCAVPLPPLPPPTYPDILGFLGQDCTSPPAPSPPSPYTPMPPLTPPCHSFPCFPSQLELHLPPSGFQPSD